MEAVCGGCGAKGLLVFFCTYTRWLDALEDGVPVSMEIELDRYLCKCGTTHVVAPGDLVIPYMRHSLGFIVAVVAAYTKREKSVRSIAEEYQIVVSTLYAWLKRFRDHYELLFGKLEAVSGDNRTHPETFSRTSQRRLFVFVETYETCFLGTRPGTGATRCFTLRGCLILSAGASP